MCVASETCLLIAEADRVLCHLVTFLPAVFLHWLYKMKYSCYQHSATQAYQCNLTQSTGMATQMQLKALFGRKSHGRPDF